MLHAGPKKKKTVRVAGVDARHGWHLGAVFRALSRLPSLSRLQRGPSAGRFRGALGGGDESGAAGPLGHRSGRVHHWEAGITVKRGY